MADFSKFEKKIGIVFNDINFLKQAFTHRSYLNERPSWPLTHNERLEFLGDAVLELAVTKYLFKEFPEKPEGELTSLRAALVNSDTLSKVAKDLGMNDFLLLSKGEKKDTGKARQYILANTFESLVGAIYIDKGFNEADKFIEMNLVPLLAEIINRNLWRDSKSYFQEKAQEIAGITPQYKVLREWGPDHSKHFEIGVFLGNELVAKGDGLSKQEAEQKAAMNGLAAKKWE